jgi:hypothetical protein
LESGQNVVKKWEKISRKVKMGGKRSKSGRKVKMSEKMKREIDIDRKLIFPLTHVILINRHLCSEEKRHVRFRL